MAPKQPKVPSKGAAEVRERVGMSLSAVSRLTRLTERTVSAYERGPLEGSGLSTAQVEHLDRVYDKLRELLEVAS